MKRLSDAEAEKLSLFPETRAYIYINVLSFWAGNKDLEGLFGKINDKKGILSPKIVNLQELFIDKNPDKEDDLPDIVLNYMSAYKDYILHGNKTTETQDKVELELREKILKEFMGDNLGQQMVRAVNTETDKVIIPILEQRGFIEKVKTPPIQGR